MSIRRRKSTEKETQFYKHLYRYFGVGHFITRIKSGSIVVQDGVTRPSGQRPWNLAIVAESRCSEPHSHYLCSLRTDNDVTCMAKLTHTTDTEQFWACFLGMRMNFEFIKNLRKITKMWYRLQTETKSLKQKEEPLTQCVWGERCMRRNKNLISQIYFGKTTYKGKCQPTLKKQETTF